MVCPSRNSVKLRLSWDMKDNGLRFAIFRRGLRVIDEQGIHAGRSLGWELMIGGDFKAGQYEETGWISWTSMRSYRPPFAMLLPSGCHVELKMIQPDELQRLEMFEKLQTRHMGLHDVYSEVTFGQRKLNLLCKVSHKPTNA